MDRVGMTIVVNLEQKDAVAQGVLRSGKKFWGENLETQVVNKLTYTAIMTTVACKPAMRAPTRLHRSPRSHITTNSTLKPSPDLS